MTYEKAKLYELPVNDLHSDPNQPRKVVDSQALDELSASISRVGIVQPIVFRQDDTGALIVVAGERRVAAARAAGLAAVPAVFVQGDYAEVALVENLLRQDLTPVEEAEALNTLMSERSYTQEQLAGIIGKAQNTLSEILSINRLPLEIRDDCRANRAISRAALITIAKKKQARGMATAYKALKEKLEKGKPPRQKKTEALPRDDIDRIAALGNKLVDLDTGIWSSDDKSALQEALSSLKERIEAILASLADAAEPDAPATEPDAAATDTASPAEPAPATAGTRGTSRSKSKTATS